MGGDGGGVGGGGGIIFNRFSIYVNISNVQ